MTQLEDRTVPTTVTIAALTSSASEGAGMISAFRLTRDNTSGPLPGYVSFGGTATAGSDFSSFGTYAFNFLDGQATTDVPVFLTDDFTSEATETIVAGVDSNSGYTSGRPVVPR